MRPADRREHPTVVMSGDNRSRKRRTTSRADESDAVFHAAGELEIETKPSSAALAAVEHSFPTRQAPRPYRSRLDAILNPPDVDTTAMLTRTPRCCHIWETNRLAGNGGLAISREKGSARWHTQSRTIGT